jgi:YVTN family beta-propeller protein
MAQEPKWLLGHFLFQAKGRRMAKLDFHGMDLINPLNRISAGRVSLAQNVRAYVQGGFTSRNRLMAAVETLPSTPHSIRRLNDSTPNGPESGYTLIAGAGTTLYAGTTSVATGLSGNPVSIVPFRPNTSVEPWGYVGDSSEDVMIVKQGEFIYTPTATITDYNAPNTVAVNETTNRIYTSNDISANVAVIDGATNTIIVDIAVGSGPYGVAVNETTNRVYVANRGNSTVSVIDGATNTVTATIAVGNNPVSVAVNETTNRIYAANNDNGTVSVIDGATNTVTATISGLDPNNDGQSIAVNETTNRVYVANYGGTVSVIDGSTNTITATIAAGDRPRSIAVNETTNRVYVANLFTSSVQVIDGSKNTVTTVITVHSPQSIAVNETTNMIYAGCQDSKIHAIYGATNVVMDTFAGPNYPTSTAVNEKTNTIYVASSQGSAVSVYGVTPKPSPYAFPCFGMVKVRSDGLTYKMGIKEPQSAPSVSTEKSSVSKSGTLYATAIPWTNYPTGTNSNFNYGETKGYPNTIAPVDGTAPYSINVANASTVKIAITMISGVTVTINGNTITTPATDGPTLASTNPGYYVQPTGGVSPPSEQPSILIGAFTDGDGNVIDAGVAPKYVKNIVDVGYTLGTEITVPAKAQAMQIGINSTGNTFSSNSGSFDITTTVTTNALPAVTATLGDLTLYYWDDSPHSGSVDKYIWKNPDDSGGSGPVRTTSDAVGSTTGNSFIFDCSFGSSADPVQEAGIPGLPGIGDSTEAMDWSQLDSESTVTGTNAVFASPLTVTHTTNTEYNNFNFCLIGSIYFPEAGNYTFILTNHDDVIWGIKGVTLVSATGSTSAGSSPTPVKSNYGQTMTVVSGISLLPRTPYSFSSNGEAHSWAKSIVVVKVSSAGTYPIELDYDYWDHSGRILLLMASPTPGAATTIIPPITSNVRQEVQYRYIYRSSATGAISNPSPASTAEAIPVTSNTITSEWSNDPQVDKVDYYRVDANVADYTYVCTGPNDDLGTLAGTNTAVTDSLTDTELGSTLLESDNFEPFPSVDLPQKGVCSVSGGVITWVSGGVIGGTATGFNTRWVAGTKILIGSPTSLAYVMTSRPTASAFAASTAYPLDWVIEDSNGHYQLVTVAGTTGSSTPTFSTTGGTTTSGTVTFTDRGVVVPPGFVDQITITGVPDGENLAYEMTEPTLAAQPLPYMWGPTDNVNYAFAVGDSLRPGTLYWCKGSNLDSAPDTNQLDVTDPSEPLVNGAISGGRGVLFSIKRSWIITPNFSNSEATATGTTGSAWTLQESSINRGLFIPRCLAVEGGGNVFFRVDDGIHVSPGGLNSKSITDDVLYSLFSHEGSVPTAVTRNGVTIYPPDDSQPQLQKFSIQNGYLYYDYVDTTNVPRTLVFDLAAMGWIWDIYQWPATIHAANEGSGDQGTLVGCQDGTVRLLSSAGTETGTFLVLTSAIGGTGWMHLRDITAEYISSSPITLECLAEDADNGSYGPPTISLPSSGGALTKLNLTNGPGANKWKLMAFQFSSTNPFQINLEGFAVKVKPWGSTAAYQTVLPFAGYGGEG